MFLVETTRRCEICGEVTPHFRRVGPIEWVRGLLRVPGRERCVRCRDRKRKRAASLRPTLDGRTEISFMV